ncbi:MAG: TIGR03915 family putative DNA repair protein [Endomicrobiia bacterium]
MRKILCYDGSYEGFICLIDVLISNYKNTLDAVEIINLLIEKEQNYIFYDKIETSKVKSEVFISKLKNLLPGKFVNDLYLYHLCDTLKLEKIVASVIIKYPLNKNILNQITNKEVCVLWKAKRSLFREIHRYKGILRFSKLDEIYYAQFKPKFNVLPILSKHFFSRYNNMNFIIYDLLRGIAFFNINNKGKFLYLDRNLDLKIKSDFIDKLWKIYFEKSAVDERISMERQKIKLPLYVREFLTEFKDCND